ncbi:unnamed protein product [Ixodes hexagonus]
MIPRRFVRFVLALFGATLASQAAHGLYEDQAGKLDWRQRFVGRPLYVYADLSPSAASGQRLIVATEKNVLAALSARTGALAWRQLHEEHGRVHAMSSSGDLVTVSGSHVRTWDLATGVLGWEKSLPPTSASRVLYDVNSSARELIAVQVHAGSHIVATVYGLIGGATRTSPDVSAPWITAETDCELVGHKYLACLDAPAMSLRVMALGESAAFRDVPLASLGLELQDASSAPTLERLDMAAAAQDEPYLALRMPRRGFAVLRMAKSGVKLEKLLPTTTQLACSQVNGTPLLGIVAPAEGEDRANRLIVYELGGPWRERDDLEGQFTLPATTGDAWRVHLLPFLRKDQSPSYKLLVVTEDDALLLFHPQGRLLWAREEALASVLTAQFIDLPLSETDAKIEQEFGDGNANLVSMFVTRITMQMCQLQSLLMSLLAGLRGGMSQQESAGASQDLTRDKFGFNKVILMSTAARKLFALDNRNGQIVWSQYFAELVPLSGAGVEKLPIFVQRTTAHYPHPPRCMVLGKHRDSGNGYLVSVNPITGMVLDQRELPYRVLQATALPFLDEEYTRGLLFLDSALRVHTYPSSASELLVEHKDMQYLFVANPATGTLTGYSLRPSTKSQLAVERVWSVSLHQDGQTISHVVMRNPLEHVHSQGRVMGDRSVLYKYLNPNLVAVVTEGVDSVHKVTSVNVHLVDGITGAFVYTATHKRARGPVHLVHSENWIVYCYHNEKSRRTEVSVVELYEGASQSNTSAFSSFTSPPAALVEHQSYVFPSSIEAMSDTVTEKGITSKHVLVALPSGAIVELPKAFLDPRRPITPTAMHREEGLMPYMPELPISAEHIVNYNQSVARVTGFATAASGLESTCLVVAYGLDLFYTRVAPSKTFDILKDDFDHVLISVVLTLLILVSYVSKRFSARKALRAAWK